MTTALSTSPTGPASASPAAPSRPVIRAEGLRRVFGTEASPIVALDGVSFAIEPGEFVAIVGKSGSGKTTLLNLIGGLDRGYEGTLQVVGAAPRSLSDRALSRFRNAQLGFVFQSFNLLANLSVGENVMLPARFSGAGAARLEPAEARARAEVLLGRVGLADRFDERPTRLSGGEKQRVAIARALLLRPPLLIGDEPTGSLDEETADGVLDLFLEVREELGTTLVLVTHDPTVAARAERVLRLDRGRLVDRGAGSPPARGDA
jgi:putative ABC transport system ATP-binding protein